MRIILIILFALCLISRMQSILSAEIAKNNRPVSDAETRIRGLINAEEFKEERAQIIKMGAPARSILLNMMKSGMESDIVSARCLILLPQLGGDPAETGPVVLPYLLAKGNFVRLNAVKALAAVDPDRYFPDIVATLDDPYEPIRRESINILEKHPTTTSQVILELWLSRPGLDGKIPPKDVAERARKALDSIRKAIAHQETRKIAKVIQKLTSSAANERRDAIIAISPAPGIESTAALVHMLNDPAPHVAAEASQHLSLRTSREVLTALRIWQHQSQFDKRQRKKEVLDAVELACKQIEQELEAKATNTSQPSSGSNPSRR